MNGTLHVESVHGSLARPLRLLGLTLPEWVVIGLVAGQVMVYSERIHRKLWLLKFSHALFLATVLGLYLIVLYFHARQPPRYWAHALQFWARKKYVIARGLRERKVDYFTR